MLRRRQRSEVVVASQDGGVVVRGEQVAVERFVERARTLIASVDGETALALLSQAKSAVDALPSRSGDGDGVLFEFSPRAVGLLKQYDAIPTGEGFFRSMVHDGANFAGNLDWKPVMPGPELVQLQTMAVTLALQASIKNLADAVERVEQKVDDIRDLIRTDQVGQVVAHHRVLGPLADSVIGGATLTATDWDSVDDLRPEIVATVERTRLYLATRLRAAADIGWTAHSRSGQANKLIEAEFANTLALLAAAEHNLASWHRLRVQRVRDVEPRHLESTVADVDRELAQQRALDAELVDDLTEFLRQVGTPTGYEGLEPVARRRLVRHTEAMWETVATFSVQRGLDRPHLEPVVMPTLTESLGQVKEVTTEGAKRAGEWARRGSVKAVKPVGRRIGIGKGGEGPMPKGELSHPHDGPVDHPAPEPDW